MIIALADLHALTGQRAMSRAEDASANTPRNLQMATELLACGLDAQKCFLMRQSKVRAGWLAWRRALIMLLLC